MLTINTPRITLQRNNIPSKQQITKSGNLFIWPNLESSTEFIFVHFPYQATVPGQERLALLNKSFHSFQNQAAFLPTITYIQKPSALAIQEVT